MPKPKAADVQAELEYLRAVSMGDYWGPGEHEEYLAAVNVVAQALSDAQKDALEQAARHADCCVDRQELADARRQAHSYAKTLLASIQEARRQAVEDCVKILRIQRSCDEHVYPAQGCARCVIAGAIVERAISALHSLLKPPAKEEG